MNRHERRKAGKYGGGFVGPSAAVEFLRRFAAAPNDADIELRDAHLADGTRLMSCQIDGYTAALTPREMRVLADCAEDAMRKFPDEPEAKTLPNLIMAFREGAARLDAIIASESAAPGKGESSE